MSKRNGTLVGMNPRTQNEVRILEETVIANSLNDLIYNSFDPSLDLVGDAERFCRLNGQKTLRIGTTLIPIIRVN